MPLYRIERTVGPVSNEEIDASIFRAANCMPLFAQMRWVRSFLDHAAGRVTCYYEAASAEDIRKHAEIAHLACDSVAEVTEYLPDHYR